MSRSALVIGGGMGGLAAALVLLQQGFEVEVHEQASALREGSCAIDVEPFCERRRHSAPSSAVPVRAAVNGPSPRAS